MASDIKWIKIVTDLFDDEKIQLIETLPEADTIITIWFKLLCLAGKCNNSGLLTLCGKIPYTDSMLATIFRRKESSVKLAMETFKNFGMIEVFNGVYSILNWEKHQNIDGMERIREQNRIRKQHQRDRERENKALIDNLSRDCHSEVTQQNKNKNKNKDLKKENISNDIFKKESDTQTSKEKSIPSTVEQVIEYMNEIGCPNFKDEAEAFFDHFSSNGWKVGGKSPMKDWKAACRNWKRNTTSNQFSKTSNSGSKLSASHVWTDASNPDEFKDYCDENGSLIL